MVSECVRVPRYRIRQDVKMKIVAIEVCSVSPRQWEERTSCVVLHATDVLLTNTRYGLKSEEIIIIRKRLY